VNGVFGPRRPHDAAVRPEPVAPTGQPVGRRVPGSIYVRQVSLAAAPDPAVWSFAAANEFVIVSKDTDFQQRALLYGFPPKVVWVRPGNCSTAAVAALLRSRLADIQAFEADPVASFLAHR
jgi:predicted nuclease of predicted toxin-antitoxin system